VPYQCVRDIESMNLVWCDVGVMEFELPVGYCSHSSNEFGGLRECHWVPGLAALHHVYTPGGVFPPLRHTRGSGNRPVFRTLDRIGDWIGPGCGKPGFVSIDYTELA
jgi:hypothetical protein